MTAKEMDKTLWSDRILAPFQRRTSSGRYLPEIDGLRCLAVVLVVLFHSHGFFTSGSEPSTVPELLATDPGTALRHMPHALIGRGWFGVQIFFLISGLVLSLPYAAHYLKGEEKPLVKNYFKRRLIRIEIPYVLALTFFLFLSIIIEQSGWGRLPNYFAGLIYAHGFIYDGQHNPLLFVAWTLEIEVQFYLIVPLLCRVFALPKLLRRFLLVLTIFAVDQLCGGSWIAFTDSIWHHTVIRQLNWFLPGLLLADLYLSPNLKGFREKGGTLWADFVGGLAWIMVFVLIDYHFTISPRPFVLLLAFWCVLASRYLGVFFRNRWITAVGVMCYTIYLFHNFFIHTIFGPHILGSVVPYEKGNWPNNALIMVVMVSVIIIACGFLYLVVEKPFARGRLPWKKKKG
ncbi:acyltransferase [Akkermansiaceae bacterium]|nr:acyltransferase [Akkermansiaceae bacterium]MDA7523107.1 acyltransferase [bacterium]MDA7509548.1 acyltransferase [Akkermansiaceae bacterium]MDA7513121.1 acyltransferase [Akkermansiaceae bacterium]MDA7612495.1 acyltransferase [bacterium]